VRETLLSIQEDRGMWVM